MIATAVELVDTLYLQLFAFHAATTSASIHYYSRYMIVVKIFLAYANIEATTKKGNR